MLNLSLKMIISSPVYSERYAKDPIYVDHHTIGAQNESNNIMLIAIIWISAFILIAIISFAVWLCIRDEAFVYTEDNKVKEIEAQNQLDNILDSEQDISTEEVEEILNDLMVNWSVNKGINEKLSKANRDKYIKESAECFALVSNFLIIKQLFT